MNDGTKFKRMLGGILAGIGLLLLLFACIAFMSADDTSSIGIDFIGIRYFYGKSNLVQKHNCRIKTGSPVRCRIKNDY